MHLAKVPDFLHLLVCSFSSPAKQCCFSVIVYLTTECRIKGYILSQTLSWLQLDFVQLDNPDLCIMYSLMYFCCSFIYGSSDGGSTVDLTKCMGEGEKECIHPQYNDPITKHNLAVERTPTSSLAGPNIYNSGAFQQQGLV